MQNIRRLFTIEVIAIDGREAEAGLLRLAGDFVRLRLFLPKQAKRLNAACEVAGWEARALSAARR